MYKTGCIILILCTALLFFKFNITKNELESANSQVQQLQEELSEAQQRITELQESIELANERIRGANDAISNAKYSAWSDYHEMGYAIDDLDEIDEVDE